MVPLKIKKGNGASENEYHHSPEFCVYECGSSGKSANDPCFESHVCNFLEFIKRNYCMAGKEKLTKTRLKSKARDRFTSMVQMLDPEFRFNLQMILCVCKISQSSEADLVKHCIPNNLCKIIEVRDMY